jgi:hypothetical protein
MTKIKYFLDFPGIHYDSDLIALIDNKYKIHLRVHPPTPTMIIDSIPTFKELIFYTDCISYTHDVPGFFYQPVQKQNKSIITPIVTIPKYENFSEERSYNLALEQIYSLIVDIKINAKVCFIWNKAYFKTINIPLTLMFYKVSEEINMYSMALKQLDPLTEFLCYYRIIERITGDNGKQWIRNNLSRLNKYHFGFLEVVDLIKHRKRNRRKNLFSFYRRRSINRILKLRRTLPKEISIEKHLYNDIRCSIAHGKDIIKYDYKNNLKEVFLDIYIVKLLSRIAIEDKVKNK